MEEAIGQQLEDTLFPMNKKIVIQDEGSRMYEFADKLIEIVEPVVLLVSEKGHMLVDHEGRGHYIPYGWKRIIFVPKKGKFEIPELKEAK